MICEITYENNETKIVTVEKASHCSRFFRKYMTEKYGRYIPIYSVKTIEEITRRKRR